MQVQGKIHQQHLLHGGQPRLSHQGRTHRQSLWPGGELPGHQADDPLQGRRDLLGRCGPGPSEEL